jgi:hypothetical protein
MNGYLIAQILGFTGMGFIMIGMQQKQYGRIVLCEIANNILAATHYIFLGGFTGMWISFASAVTNVIYWYRNKKGLSNFYYQIAFGILFVLLALLSWHGFFSIFILLAKLISSVSLGINNPRIIRLLKLISFPCWLIYDISVGSIAGIVGDAMSIASVVIGIVRLDILHKEPEKAT